MECVRCCSRLRDFVRGVRAEELRQVRSTDQRKDHDTSQQDDSPPAARCTEGVTGNSSSHATTRCHHAARCTAGVTTNSSSHPTTRCHHAARCTEGTAYNEIGSRDSAQDHACPSTFQRCLAAPPRYDRRDGSGTAS